MRYASPRVVLLVTALFSIRPVHAAIAGAMEPDQAALRVMLSLAVAWVLVGVLTGVSHSFMAGRRDHGDGPGRSGSEEDR
jgi:hypothetical protein